MTVLYSIDVKGRVRHVFRFKTHILTKVENTVLIFAVISSLNIVNMFILNNIRLMFYLVPRCRVRKRFSACSLCFRASSS